MRAGDTVRQVVTATKLVDLSTLTETSYALRIYEVAAAGAKRSDGTYEIAPGAQTISEWTFNSGTDELTIAGKHRGTAQNFTYRFDPATEEWTLDKHGEEITTLHEEKGNGERVVREKTKGPEPTPSCAWLLERMHRAAGLRKAATEAPGPLRGARATTPASGPYRSTPQRAPTASEVVTLEPAVALRPTTTWMTSDRGYDPAIWRRLPNGVL